MTRSHSKILITTGWLSTVALAGWLGAAWSSAEWKAVVRTLQMARPAAPSPAPPRLVKPGADAASGGGDHGDSATGTAGMPADALTMADRAKALFAIEDPVERMTAFLALLGGLKSDEDMSAVLDAMLDGFEPRGRGREYSMLMTQWAKRNPVATLEYTKKLDGWKGRWGANTALAIWAKDNPEGALAWARVNGNNDPKNEEGNWYLSGALAGLAKTDLDTAARLATEMPQSKARGEIMDRLLDGMTHRGDSAAQNWIAGLPEGSFREGVTRRLAGRLADQDPQASIAFVENQPAGAWKREAYAEAVDRWADRDPNAAGAWLGQYPPGPETDDPRRAFAWKIRERDPESAIAWAGTISEARRRDKMMVEIARDWYKREPQAAQAFVDRQGWPDSTRRKVLN